LVLHLISLWLLKEKRLSLDSFTCSTSSYMLMSWYMSGYHTGYYQVSFLCCDVYSFFSGAYWFSAKKETEIVYLEIACCYN
uniref:SMN domain-containing protein n=1 Tax=Angiostrongylus cantonensis TaxID=6313 RepID=A0A0K0DML7_ANGCA